MNLFKKISVYTLCVIFCIWVQITSCSSYFRQEPNVLIAATNASQSISALKISPNQDRVILGYMTGVVRTLNITDGTTINSYTNHTTSIVDIQWIPNYGPLVLDQAGFLTNFGTNSSFNFTKSYSAAPLGISATQDSKGNFYLAVNFAAMVVEFTNFLTQNSLTYDQLNLAEEIFKKQSFIKKAHGYFSKSYINTALYQGNLTTYYPLSGSAFTNCYYVANHSLIYLFTNTSQIMWIQPGTTNYTSYPVPMPITINQVNGPDAVALSSDYNVHIVQYSPNGTYNISQFVLMDIPSNYATCPETNLLVFGENSDYGIRVYNYNGSIHQTLGYMSDSLLLAECSTNYLVTLDSTFLAINTYQPAPSPDQAPFQLPIVVIVSIAIVGGALLVGFIACAVCYIRKLINPQNLALKDGEYELKQTPKRNSLQGMLKKTEISSQLQQTIQNKDPLTEKPIV